MKEKLSWRPLALSLVILGALSRFLPHPPNMTVVGAASLFSGARLRGWQAWLVPVACMLATDPILGFVYGFRPFSWVTPFVYAAFLVNVWLGRRLTETTHPVRIGGLAFLGSLQFFLVSNFGVWAMGGGHAYAHTLAGLLTCYVAALPFFGRMLVADLGYTTVLFGLHLWLSRRVFTAERVAAAAVE